MSQLNALHLGKKGDIIQILWFSDDMFSYRLFRGKILNFSKNLL